MPFTLDPELAAALAPPDGEQQAPPPTDWRSIRLSVADAQATIGALVRPRPEVTRTAYSTISADGARIALRWFAPPDRWSRAAVVHAHGGGMVAGSVDLFDPYTARLVGDSGVPVLSVEYRLAPEVTGSTPAEDVFAGVQWLAAHADELRVDPGRIGLWGESSGGGIAAATAILARERGAHIAGQLLVYPMLDDRTIDPDPQLEGLATWTWAQNRTGWESLLGDDRGTDAVSATAAPGRLEEFAGLPPTYIEVGALDAFRDEDVRYAQRLLEAGVPTELHVHPGVPHGFDQLAPDAAVTRRALADRVRFLRAL